MTPERQLDPEALGDHIDRLFRAAWSLCGSREEAEDLVQETFARVLRKPRLLRSEDDLGYLLRVLRNTFFSQRRTAARRPQTTALPDDLDLDRGSLRDPTRVPDRIRRAVCRDLRLARRLPRRADRDRRRRSLLPRGGRSAEGPRGDDHDAAAPCTPAGREHAGRLPSRACHETGRRLGRTVARLRRRRTESGRDARPPRLRALQHARRDVPCADSTHVCPACRHVTTSAAAQLQRAVLDTVSRRHTGRRVG